MVPNPLAYSIHAHRLPEHQAAVQQALALRSSQVTHATANRILDAQGLHLGRRAYYNLQRDFSIPKDEGDLQTIFRYLEEEGFHVRSRYTYDMDSATGQPVRRQLEQIFFMSEDQIRLGQRFCSGFALQIDSTFNTNTLKLPLTILVGITNTGKTFPLAFSFIPSEDRLSMDFIFLSLTELAWDEFPPPKVIIADQGSGLVSSLPDSMPDSTLQLCEWHAFQNIKKRLTEAGYTKEHRQIIQPLIWDYLHAGTVEALEKRKETLFKALKTPEVTYLRKNWVVKEKQVCRAYTSFYANLGGYTTQRGESMHSVMKQSLNRQLGLSECCKRIARQLRTIHANLLAEEMLSMVHTPRVLDMTAFATVLGKITIFALDILAPEWTIVTLAAPPLHWENGCHHNCSLPVQFGLPCRHWMARAFSEGFPLPFSLIHPRWWLSGGPVHAGAWEMGYYDAALDPQEQQPGRFSNRGRDLIMSSMHQVLDQQSHLLSEDAERIALQVVNNNAQVLAEMQALEERERQLPAEMPTPVPPNPNLQLKKKKGSTRKRALTGAEAAERQETSPGASTGSRSHREQSPAN